MLLMKLLLIFTLYLIDTYIAKAQEPTTVGVGATTHLSARAWMLDSIKGTHVIYKDGTAWGTLVDIKFDERGVETHYVVEVPAPGDTWERRPYPVDSFVILRADKKYPNRLMFK